MNRVAFSLLVLLLMGLTSYLHAQEADNRGTPISVTQLGPKRSGPRWSYREGSCISDSTRVVIRDGDAWNSMWKRMWCGPVPPAPEIDFTREMVIVAALGERPSPSYGIVVDKGYDLGDKVEIIVQSITRKCGMVLGIETHPIELVVVPKTDRPVVFREVKAVAECKPDGSFIIRDLN
ncbi:MAG TPA: protease complex subunit PrcB family protein [Pyrinomonadaceae bacterium]|nr:protease complex subunit PrcB family protein [Pyrinomonadaceae bacterium]